MTEREAIRALRSVRIYCMPAHLAAVDHAIEVLRERERERTQRKREETKKCSC